MPKAGEIAYLRVLGERGIQHAANKPFSDTNAGGFLIALGSIRLLLPPPPARILELGCGTGWVSCLLGKMGYEVVGQDGRLFLLNDAKESYIWSPEGESKMRPIELPQETDPWPAGPAMVRDLVQAVRTGQRTACDLPQARRATEIGFAIHTSSAGDGAKVHLPVEDRSLRIESFPWGNE